MTREEAVKKHYDIKCHITESKKILAIIDQIFNDHEAQLNAKDEKLQQLDDAYASVVSDYVIENNLEHTTNGLYKKEIF